MTEEIGIILHPSPGVEQTPAYRPFITFVLPTDIVDPELTRCLNKLDLMKSCYYEPAIVVGQNVPLDTERTFAEYNIQDGDSLHLFLCDRVLRIFARRTLLSEQMYYADVLASFTITRMLEGKCSRLSRNSMGTVFLKNSERVLEGKKTLADSNIRGGDILDVGTRSYTFTVLVPDSPQMIRRVLFEQCETIGNLKAKLRMIQAHNGFTAVILRGAIQNGRPDTNNRLYMYLHLDKMEAFWTMSCQKCLPDPKFHRCRSDAFNLKEHHSVKDIYGLVGSVRCEKMNYCTTNEKWPKAYAYDCRWTQTFAPQIEAEVNAACDNKAMRLFFFPYCTDKMQVRNVAGTTRISVVKEAVCEMRNLNAPDWELLCTHPGANGGSFREGQNIVLCEYDQFLQDDHFIHLVRAPRYPPRLCRTIGVFVIYSNHGMPVALRLDRGSTVACLKDAIEDDIQIPYFLQRLFINGQCITYADAFVLSDVGITDGAVVYLLPVNADG